MQSLGKVILKTKKDNSLRRMHPWVFSGAIKKIKNHSGNEYQPKNGEIVEVYSNHDEYLATGHYQAGSIAVRIFSFRQINPDIKFWEEKLTKAFELRKGLNLFSEDNNVCRLVFAEGDELPGLIIDYYNGTAVMQCHSVGMHALKMDFTEILKSYFGEKLNAVYDKSAETLKVSQYVAENRYLYQRDKNISGTVVKENNCLFKIDWEQGQKTGFFIDQRENRKLLAQFSKDKKVLNTFCYTGGFSVYALKAGAKLVHSVDSSEKAIRLTDENIALNKLKNHQSFKSDTLQFLQNTDEDYDIIILDPPAYAKHRDARHKAVQGYKRLNATAMQKIKSGGFLFTFSCSQVVDKKLFYDTITAAAINAGRSISVIAQVGQPADHPVSIYHPEGEYLKGLIIRVI